MPKRFETAPRRAKPSIPPTVVPTPVAVVSIQPPQGIIAQLRARTTFMTLEEVAEVLRFKNPKRVYALKLKRYPVGEEGDKALRWDPWELANYLEQRIQDVRETTE